MVFFLLFIRVDLDLRPMLCNRLGGHALIIAPNDFIMKILKVFVGIRVVVWLLAAGQDQDTYTNKYTPKPAGLCSHKRRKVYVYVMRSNRIKEMVVLSQGII